MAYLETISFLRRGGGEGGGRHVNKLNHIVKQSYNISEHYLILGGGENRAL